MIYLIDKIFWNLGFKNETQAEKVIIWIIRIIDVILLIRIILIISIISLVQVELGIADHVWQEKSAAITGTIDALGNRFEPELRTGCQWLAYIRETYSDWLRQLPPWEKPERPWCLIESLMLLVCMLTDSQWWMCQLASFLQWIHTQIAFFYFWNNRYNMK